MKIKISFNLNMYKKKQKNIYIKNRLVTPFYVFTNVQKSSQHRKKKRLIFTKGSKYMLKVMCV